MKQYEKLMKKCITLAKKGKGKVSPNPMVGAIIFDDSFNVISTGYHQKYGEAHAEVNAVKNAKTDLKGKSIIVNLEPCSHHGKTPPCADLIIKNKFKKVIVGMVDPNPLVAGQGILKLQEAGIEVITGVLEDECKKLNEVFIKNHTEKKPFITIKTATTLDGKIATSTGSSKWITDEKSRNYVQKLRNDYDAILTGSGTIIKDNPSLNCRLKSGKNPIRIILDTNLKADPKSNVYKNDETKVIVATKKDIEESKIQKFPKNVEFVKCSLKNNHIDLNELLTKLFKMSITSIMVEAGSTLNSSFIKEGLADKLIQFLAPKIIGDKDAINFVENFNVKDINDSIKLKTSTTKTFDGDIMIESYFEKN